MDAAVLVELEVLRAGSCYGGPRNLRSDATAAKPATTESRRRVQSCVKALLDDGESVTPTRVARKMAAKNKGELCMPDGWIRDGNCSGIFVVQGV